MSAPTLPRQRTQAATCPYCGDPVPGLMSGHNKPACVKAEIDEIVALDQQLETDDE